METVSVVVRRQGDARKQYLLIESKLQDTIASLKTRIRHQIDTDDDLLVIFSGKQLENSQNIRDLQLGPNTSLTVTIKPTGFTGLEVTQKRAREPLNSFNVYCKNCESVRPGKLRASCSHCSSSSILFLEEPNTYLDISLRDRVHVTCYDCVGKTWCKFALKCAECSESAMFLYHIVPNRERSECVICGDVENTVFSMSCQHTTCIACISAYMEQVLNQWLLVYKKDLGFSLSCPMVNCLATVTDPHHFYLCGKENYRIFQRKSAQKYLEMQVGSVYCPFPECNAGFSVEADPSILETDVNDVLCPECNRKFCVKCRGRGKCICGAEDQSIKLVKALSKPCPRCRVPTERNGGCSHMRCFNCTYDWCFLCECAWADGCQWDHWFD